MKRPHDHSRKTFHWESFRVVVHSNLGREHVGRQQEEWDCGPAVDFLKTQGPPPDMLSPTRPHLLLIFSNRTAPWWPSVQIYVWAYGDHSFQINSYQDSFIPGWLFDFISLESKILRSWGNVPIEQFSACGLQSLQQTSISKNNFYYDSEPQQNTKVTMKIIKIMKGLRSLQHKEVSKR